MRTVEASGIFKTFGSATVVNDLSFAVEQGEILGLIGPNGAGKTTAIRIVMDILKPDRGEVKVLGAPTGAAVRSRIGYLPEERGLYRKLELMECLVYLASLKGMDKRAAERRAGELLERVGLGAHARKRIEELSKGMGQLVQLLVAIIHDPELIILDEPHSGLDPVNAELLKEILLDLRNKGKAVILSTHRMNEVEELCDRVLMMDHGKAVLYGSLQEIRIRYRRNAVSLRVEGEPGELPGVVEKSGTGGCFELVLREGFTPYQLLRELVERNVRVTRFEVATLPLHEIFLDVVRGSGGDTP